MWMEESAAQTCRIRRGGLDRSLWSYLSISVCLHFHHHSPHLYRLISNSAFSLVAAMAVYKERRSVGRQAEREKERERLWKVEIRCRRQPGISCTLRLRAWTHVDVWQWKRFEGDNWTLIQSSPWPLYFRWMYETWFEGHVNNNHTCCI